MNHIAIDFAELIGVAIERAEAKFIRYNETIYAVWDKLYDPSSTYFLQATEFHAVHNGCAGSQAGTLLFAPDLKQHWCDTCDKIVAGSSCLYCRQFERPGDQHTYDAAHTLLRNTQSINARERLVEDYSKRIRPTTAKMQRNRLKRKQR